jgi:hypothetical protein
VDVDDRRRSRNVRAIGCWRRETALAANRFELIRETARRFVDTTVLVGSEICFAENAQIASVERVRFRFSNCEFATVIKLKRFKNRLARRKLYV